VCARVTCAWTNSWPAEPVDDAVHAYLDAVDPWQRTLFDRIHRLVLQVHPGATVILSYRMPTFVVGRCRLYVGVWQHGLSFYGWEPGRDAGFSARHPEWVVGKGTLKVAPADAAQISDEEFRAMLHASLSGPADDYGAP